MVKLSTKQRKNNTEDSRFAVTVTFEIDQKCFREFLPLMHQNAKASVRDEPGCLRFDVLVPAQPSTPPLVFLYEVYETRAAFDVHLSSPHFLAFDAATRDMILAKSVAQYLAFENVKPS
jgi:(4S)-4-hydroxy-5-phosphonooxypentane-2,3-dione isomerase